MSTVLTVVRWLVRAIALLLAGVVIVVAVGEGVDFPNLKGGEVGMLAALFLSVTGLILLAVPPYRNRRRIVAGSVLNLLGIGAVYVTDFGLSGRFPTGWVFPLFFVPGVFELVIAATAPDRCDRRNLPSTESP